jgi:hypothetical protein
MTARKTGRVSEPSLHRPPQATLAGWLVVVGSVVVVLTALDQAAALHSLDTRETVQSYLSKPPGDTLGLGVQGGLTMLRVLTTVTAVAGAASAVLGWYALRRSKGARWALTVLAVPLFLVGFSFHGLVTDGVFPAMVAAAVVILWFQPARDWFDGKAPTPAPTPPPVTEPAPPSFDRDPLLDLPPPIAPPLHPTPYAAQPAAPPTPVHRPASVTWACVLAWLSTAAVFGLLAMVVVVMVASPGAFLDAAHRANPDLSNQGVSDAELKVLTYVLCAVVMAWSAVAAALAFLTWRRVGWAATGLAVSAGLASGLCLLTAVGALSAPFLVPLASCAATLGLLLRRESLAWFRRSPQPSRRR